MALGISVPDSPFPPSQESGTLPVGARQAGAHTCECHTEVCGRVLWWDSRVCPWGSATPASRTARAPLCSGMSSRNVTGRGHRDQLVPRPLSASVQPFPPQEPPCRANSELRTSTDSTCRHCPEVQRTAAELWGPGCRCPCISPLTALCEEAGPARAAGSSWGRSRVTSGLLTPPSPGAPGAVVLQGLLRLCIHSCWLFPFLTFSFLLLLSFSRASLGFVSAAQEHCLKLRTIEQEKMPKAAYIRILEQFSAPAPKHPPLDLSE